MKPGRFSGTIPLFRVFGIRVSLHWSWFLAAAILVQIRSDIAGIGGWAALIDLLLAFGIVTLHEFGHALACKSVGGEARSIVLWPLGGVAFVKPPMRPGAYLWSIVAGPLVNVILFPVTLFLVLYWQLSFGNIHAWPVMVFYINLALLLFNMLPVYPLDGGQILQSLLWYFVGFARSLKIVSIIGLIVGGLGGLAALVASRELWTTGRFVTRELWMVVMAAFIVLRAWGGFQTAQYMIRLERQRSAGMMYAPYEIVRGAADVDDRV